MPKMVAKYGICKNLYEENNWYDYKAMLKKDDDDGDREASFDWAVLYT